MWLPLLLVVLLTASYTHGQGHDHSQRTESSGWAREGQNSNRQPQSQGQGTPSTGTGRSKLVIPITQPEIRNDFERAGYSRCGYYNRDFVCWSQAQGKWVALLIQEYDPKTRPQQRPEQPSNGDEVNSRTEPTTEKSRPNTQESGVGQRESNDGSRRPSPGLESGQWVVRESTPSRGSGVDRFPENPTAEDLGFPESTTDRTQPNRSRRPGQVQASRNTPGQQQFPGSNRRPTSQTTTKPTFNQDLGIGYPESTAHWSQVPEEEVVPRLPGNRPGSRNPGRQRPGTDRRPANQDTSFTDQTLDVEEPDREDFRISGPQSTTDRYRPNNSQGSSFGQDRTRPPPNNRSPGNNRRPTTEVVPSYDDDQVQTHQTPSVQDFVVETSTQPSKGSWNRNPGTGSGQRVPGPNRRPNQPIGTVDPDQEPETQNLDPKAQVAFATCKFSLDVFKTALKNSPGNVIMSPLSVQTVLAMLQQGARSRSSQQLEDVLYVRPDVSKAGYTAVIKEYQKHPNELTLASKIFVHPDFAVLPQFSKTLLDHFNSGVQPLPRSSPAATSTINNWVREKTKNRITELVKPGDVTTRTQMVLANVIHFKAEWLRTFDIEETRVEKFHTTPNEEIDVFMMQNEGLFNGGRDDQLKAYWLDMLYDSSDRDFSMIAVLPTEPHGLDAVIDRLNVGHLKKMMDSKTTYHVFMKMPRFKLNADTSLKEILLQLGLRDVFDQRSHLEGISKRTPLVVSEIVHSAEIEVTEEGTEAAGASALYGHLLTYTPNYERLDFNATQPFLAIIVDNIHKMPLFMTRVSNPGLFAPVEE